MTELTELSLRELKSAWQLDEKDGGGWVYWQEPYGLGLCYGNQWANLPRGTTRAAIKRAIAVARRSTLQERLAEVEPEAIAVRRLYQRPDGSYAFTVYRIVYANEPACPTSYWGNRRRECEENKCGHGVEAKYRVVGSEYSTGRSGTGLFDGDGDGSGQQYLGYCQFSLAGCSDRTRIRRIEKHFGEYDEYSNLLRIPDGLLRDALAVR